MNDKYVYKRPDWVETGSIGHNDVNFLNQIIRKLKPECGIEIGVASGYSSAVILQSMQLQNKSSILYSFDIMENCYFNDKYPVGYAFRQMVPNCLSNWYLYTGKNAFDAGQLLQGYDVPFVFIDANHKHPWATLDLMALLPAISSTSCIVLHDISQKISNKNIFFGPKHLYDIWPFRKYNTDNIGALLLPDDHDSVFEVCIKSLSTHWQQLVDRSYLDNFHTIGYKILCPNLLSIVDRIQKGDNSKNRPIWIWGAGSTGKILYKHLNDFGLHVQYFIDSNPSKQNTCIDSIKIISTLNLNNFTKVKPFIIIASSSYKEIIENIKCYFSLFHEDKDYFVLNK